VKVEIFRAFGNLNENLKNDSNEKSAWLPWLSRDDHPRLQREVVQTIGKLKIQDEAVVKKLEELLESAEDSVKEAAIEALGNIHAQRSIIPLLELLEKSKTTRIAETLAKFNMDNEAVKRVIGLLKDQSWNVKSEGARIIGNLQLNKEGQDEAGTELVKLLNFKDEEDKSQEVRRMAAAALIKLKIENSKAIDVFVDLLTDPELTDPDNHIGFKTVETLCEIEVKDKKVISGLVVYMKKVQSWNQVKTVVGALEKLAIDHPKEELAPLLIEKLEYYDNDVKKQVVSAIGNLKVTEAIVRLKEMLQDNNENHEVREKVAEALGQLAKELMDSEKKEIISMLKEVSELNGTREVRDAARKAHSLLEEKKK